MSQFRTTVFKTAHKIRKNTGKKFSICLMQAWQAYRLRKSMMLKKVKFAYETLSGSLRYAVGTLQVAYSSKGSKKPNYGVMTYYDLDKAEYRSFRVENLIRVYN